MSVGWYNSDSAENEPNVGVIVVESSGGFTSMQAPLPADASTFNPFVYLNDVSCPQVGACVVLGTYMNTSGDTLPFVETLSGGTWTPTVLSLPADAVTNNADYPATYLAYSHLSCPSVGDCAAIGWYSTLSNSTAGVIETDTNGTWSALEAPVPANVYSQDTCKTQPGGATVCFNGQSQVLSISCSSTESCVAVGTYNVGLYQSAGYWQAEDQAFADTLSGGMWSATELPLPSDANMDATMAGVGVGSSYLNGWTVSCAGSSQCAVSGHYYSTADVGITSTAEADLLDTSSNGTWTAQAAPLPSNAVVPQSLFDYDATVACASGGSCVAAGYYQASSAPILNSPPDFGYIDSLSDGTWTSVQATVPAGITGDGTMYPSTVACPADGQCVVAGYEGGDDGGAFYENQEGDTWVPTQAPLPGIDVSTSPSISLTNLSCPEVGACSAGLTAAPQTTNFSTFFIETDPSLPPSSTRLSIKPSDPAGGESVTLSATVSSKASVTTGTVSFWSGLVYLCSAKLVDGSASCEVSSWPSGPFSVGASYSGNATVAPSATAIPFQVEATSLPSATPKVAYWANVAVAGGNPPYKWAVVSGRLPKGLHLDGSTGVISGMPNKTDTGTSRFTVRVVDTKTLKTRSNPSTQNVATQTLSIVIT